jgi:hypothetical protein
MNRIFRGLIGVLLLWAAANKIVTPRGGPTIYDSWVAWAPVLYYLVPTVEVILAIWIVSGWRLSLSASLCLVLMSSFSALLLIEFGKDHPKPCGCMGSAAVLYEPAVIRKELLLGLGSNAAMMAGLAYLFLSAHALGSKDDKKIEAGSTEAVASV